MPDIAPTTYAFGRLPSDPTKPKLRLRRSAVERPAPPASCDWLSAVREWGVLGNSEVGDCTIAAAAHTAIAVDRYGQGRDTVITDREALDTYSALTGYNPADPSTDVGATLQDALDYWRKTGIAGNQIVAFAFLDAQDLDLVRTAIATFGSVYCGMMMPASAMDELDHSLPWANVGRSRNLGGHCLAPGTRVLTSDLRWVPIETVQPGDGLIGFDELVGVGKRKYRLSTVESTYNLRLPCYELEFEDGTTVISSEDHLWFVAGSGGSGVWLSTDKMRVRGPGGAYGTKVRKIAPVYDTDDSRDAGYLAAAFDGEGWMDSGAVLRSDTPGVLRGINKIGFAQRDNAMWEHVTRALKDRGFDYHSWDKPGSFQQPGQTVRHLTVSRRDQLFRFLGSIRPHRLLSNFYPERLGALHGADSVALTKKTFIGEHPVVALGTSTRTFIAEGLASHNCVPIGAYDADTFSCTTWGQVQKMTVDFYLRFFDEIAVPVDLDWIQAVGTSPAGLDIATLNSDFECLTGERGPFPLPPVVEPPPVVLENPDLELVAAQNAWRTAKGLQ